ncbi:MAG TPA: sulfotransferase domain-containing protein, partial [Chitinophagaceae bacterium]|nr:sulfotransferase domain-containing protein [Chitinophagaceae bacterium]
MIDFVAIGPPKSGTTFLQNILVQHPGIFLSEKKEIQFFNHYYDKGIDWYHKHFQDKQDNEIAGEISPTYCDSLQTLQRIKEYAEEYRKYDFKIIITYRDPLKRLISEYHHNIRRSNYDMSIKQAIDAELNSGKNDKYYKILRNSKYNEITEDVYSLFDRENVLCLNAEKELYNKKNLKSTIEKIEKFLSVSSFSNYNFEVDDNSSYTPKSYLLQKVLYQENIIKQISK